MTFRRQSDVSARIVNADPYSHDETAAAVARLTATIEAQARTIDRYKAALARSRDVFERATSAARVGLWECDLTTEALAWSGGTYDMFGIHRDRPLRRRQTLIRYPQEQLKTLNTLRDRAIIERNGFDLDAEIVTPTGARRWIRITAAVECDGNRPIRLFGLKQDITEQTERWQRARRLAEFDELTGLANRRQLKNRLAVACGDDGGHRPGPNVGGALLMLDLDGFKSVNDSFGHAAGDECLKETARRLSRVCDADHLVARLGGDEFAVFLPAADDGQATLTARKIIAIMAMPFRHGMNRLDISVSIGIASLAGCTSREALKHADQALYAAKAAGRGTFRRYAVQQTRP